MPCVINSSTPLESRRNPDLEIIYHFGGTDFVPFGNHHLLQTIIFRFHALHFGRRHFCLKSAWDIFDDGICYDHISKGAHLGSLDPWENWCPPELWLFNLYIPPNRNSQPYEQDLWKHMKTNWFPLIRPKITIKLLFLWLRLRGWN